MKPKFDDPKWYWEFRSLWMDSETVCMGDSYRCVYEWYTSDGPFYVGQGLYDRFRTAGIGRNDRTREIVNTRIWNYRILAYGMTEREARDMERDIIKKYKAQGIKLTNYEHYLPRDSNNRYIKD